MANLSESDRNTDRFEDDGSRCPGPGCDCPDCRAERLLDAFVNASPADGPDGYRDEDGEETT